MYHAWVSIAGEDPTLTGLSPQRQPLKRLHLPPNLPLRRQPLNARRAENSELPGVICVQQQRLRYRQNSFTHSPTPAGSAASQSQGSSSNACKEPFSKSKLFAERLRCSETAKGKKKTDYSTLSTGQLKRTAKSDGTTRTKNWPSAFSFAIMLRRSPLALLKRSQ